MITLFVVVLVIVALIAVPVGLAAALEELEGNNK